MGREAPDELLELLGDAEGLAVSLRLPRRGGEGSEEELDDERYRNVDPKLIEVIKNEILDDSASVEWADIAGANTYRSARKLA